MVGWLRGHDQKAYIVADGPNDALLEEARRVRREIDQVGAWGCIAVSQELLGAMQCIEGMSGLEQVIAALEHPGRKVYPGIGRRVFIERAGGDDGGEE